MSLVEIKDDRPRWEHHCIVSDNSDTYHSFLEKLNIAGYEGWEVINIVETKDNDSMNLKGCIWKAWLKRKYRFERVLHFGDDKPFDGEPQDNVYYV